MQSVGIWRAPAPGFFPNRMAFPERTAGRHPQIFFRGLLKLYSRYGPPICLPTYRGLCHEAPIPAVTRRTGSLAIQVYRHLLGVGLSPTGDFRPWGARSFGNSTISRFFIAGGGHAVIVVSFGNFTFLAAAEGEGTVEGWLAAHGVLLVLSVAGSVKENGALREESG